MKRTLIAFAVLSACSGTTVAATSPAPLSFEQRLQALETNMQAQRKQTDEALAALEQARTEIAQLKASQADATAIATDPMPELSGNSNSNSNGNGNDNPNAFNPAISIVLNGSFTSHSLDPDAYSRSGFALVGEGAPAANGLSLGESEISFATNIDEKFYGQLTLAIGSEDGETDLAVEEAYIDTTALPEGFTLRAGRFFSNVGYLNSHHAHTDKFFDRPLAYQALLGNQYGDDGVQLRWVAPTDLFLEVGAEVFRGQNFPAGGAAHSGAGVQTVFAHAGGDIGDESSWLAGVSVLKSSSEQAEDGFTGDSELYIADGTWKWAPEGNFKDGGVTLRAEYFLERRDGALTDNEDPLINEPWNGERRGAYVEGIYRINRNWEAGYRFDRLWPDAQGPLAADHDPTRHSMMISWLNSEFSLLRLQYSHDKPNPADTDDALTLQYQVNLGAHGAHKF